MASHVRKRRVLAIMHESLVPPPDSKSYTFEERQEFRTEDDVVTGLRELGHEVQTLGLSDSLTPLRQAIREWQPHVVFNLLEEFHGEVVYDYHLVAYLELKRVAYTGCNPRGLLIARDKALSKKILHYHRVKVPRFHTFVRGRKVKRPKHLDFPLIVKSLIHEASYGIAQASVVHDDEALGERVRFIHTKIGTDAIVEQFIDGREVYAAVLGNQRLKVFPTWELNLSGLPDDAVKIATRKVKWDLAYQARHKVTIAEAKGLSDELQAHIERTSKRICRCLGLDGYVRIDYRLTPDGQLYFLEANPNPDVAYEEEFSSAAEAAGLKYTDLLQRIISLGMSRGLGKV
ncbi:MAG: ATP-grasp domain-containing protein [Polyangiaceae bacterium]